MIPGYISLSLQQNNGAGTVRIFECINYRFCEKRSVDLIGTSFEFGLGFRIQPILLLCGFRSFEMTVPEKEIRLPFELFRIPDGSQTVIRCNQIFGV